MSIFIDTSMVVRYLMDDPPEMAGQAAKVIDGENNLRLTDVVIAETAYVLTSVYRVSRETVVDFLIAFLNKQNISLFQLDKGVVLEALLLCRPSARVSFADAMLWAAARSAAGSSIIYTLDERFPGEGVDVRRGLD